MGILHTFALELESFVDRLRLPDVRAACPTNLRARLAGTDVPTDVFAKLAPAAVLRSHPTWSELGQLFLLLDERGRASVWIGRPG